MLLALTTLLNQILSYFGIDLEVLGYIGGVSLLPMIFLYLASCCFQFCNYHRMFLHYVVICDILTLIDYYIGIPVSALLISEEYQYLTGEIGKRLFKVAKKFLCDHCRKYIL